MQSLAAFLSRNKTLILAFIFFFLFSVFIKVFADAPSGGYNQGATLDPDCLPDELLPEPCIVKTVGGNDTSVQYNDNGVFAGDENFTWDKDLKFFAVGDMEETANKTKFEVDDSVQGITSSGLFGAAFGPGFILNYGTSQFLMGDINGEQNYTAFEVNDASQEINANSTGKVRLGDILSAGNDTLFTLDDTAQTIDGIAQVGGIGGAFSINATDAHIAWQSGTIENGFSADATGTTLEYNDGVGNSSAVFAGAGELVFANNDGIGNTTQWEWPNVDSTGTQALVSDGAGNLDWQSFGNVEGNGTAGQVTYWDGTDSVAGNDNFFWDNTNGRLGIGTNTPNTILQINQGTTSIGTVSNGASGSVVTGVGTTFSTIFKVGDTITIGGETQTVSTVSSDTSMITSTWTAAHSAVTYTLAGGQRFNVLGNGWVTIGGNAFTTLPLQVQSTQDATIASKSTNIEKYAGMNMFDYNGTLSASFQYGNPSATSFANQYVIASRQTNIPVLFYQGGVTAARQRLILGTDATIQLLNANVGVQSTAPTTNFQVAQPTDGIGTVSTTASGTTVTGSSTQFLNTFRVGDTITANAETRTISAIASNTSMTTDAWTGANSAVAYTLTGGTRFSVLGNGRVGIGTTTPSKALEIVNSGIKISGGSAYESGEDSYRFIVDSGASYGHYLMNLRNSLGTVLLATGNNVGVGTGNPTTKFQVAQGTAGYGTVTTNGTTTLTGSSTQFLNTFKPGDTITVSGETVRTIATVDSDTSLTVTVAFSTSASGLSYTLTGGTRFSVLGNGFVGIGTTTPESLLHLVTDTVTSGATGINLDMYGNMAPNFVGKRANGTIASPTAVLSGNNLATFSTYGHGTTEFYSDANGLMRFKAAENFTDSAKGTNLTFELASIGSNLISEKMRISSEGYVGIGTTTPSVALDVTGDIEYTGTITDMSDERLKENITEYTGGLDLVKQVGVKNYNMISSPEKDETGFIAQNINEIFPKAVSIVDPANGYMGVSYVSFIPVLTQAIQELDLKVEAMRTFEDETFVEKLQNYFADIANRIEDLFVNRIHIRTLCVGEEGDETCITKSELDALLEGQDMFVEDIDDNEEVVEEDVIEEEILEENTEEEVTEETVEEEVLEEIIEEEVVVEDVGVSE